MLIDANREKTEAQRELLLKAIETNVLFLGMNKEHKLKIIAKMWHVDVQKGTRVVQQGEMGDNFYVIEKGKMHVFILGPDGKELSKKTGASR